MSKKREEMEGLVIQYDIPVTIFVFNRPDETRKLIERLVALNPAKLLVVADAPRPGNYEDVKNCQEVLEIVKSAAWTGEVLFNIAQSNLGCRRRIQTGITWALANHSTSIFLEDDCLPDPSFFEFMRDMLVRFEGESRVGMVSGNNFLWPARKNTHGYYFSAFSHIWGWGTWSRAWELYEPNAESWPEQDKLSFFNRIFPFKIYRRAWIDILDNIDRVNTWDYQWSYTLWKNELLSVVPGANLVENIGLNPDGTHTLSASSHYQNQVGTYRRIQRSTISIPTRVKRSILRDTDELLTARIFAARQLNLEALLDLLIKRILGR